MARCEVCKLDQYPANTVVRFDEKHLRHFFCSTQHAEQWAVDVQVLQERERLIREDIHLLRPPETSPSSEEERSTVVLARPRNR